MINIAVLYPHTDDIKFDMTYYLKTHMKLVRDHWNSMGLHGSRVLKGTPGPDGSAPAYAVMALLEFESMADFGKAVAAHGREIMGDIPNFTNAKPIMQFSDPVS